MPVKILPVVEKYLLRKLPTAETRWYGIKEVEPSDVGAPDKVGDRSDGQLHSERMAKVGEPAIHGDSTVDGCRDGATVLCFARSNKLGWSP